MPEPYTAQTYTLGKLLTREMPLRVPLYQRPYTWRAREVKDFWDDLAGFSEYAKPGRIDDQYFLGSVVLVDRSTHLEVLDGQQRMATATILLAVAKAQLEKAGTEKWLKEAIKVSKYIADEELGEEHATYRLELSKQDKGYFRNRVQAWDGKKKISPKRFLSHKRINAAYNFLIKSVQELADADGPEGVIRMTQLLVHNVTLVVCESASYVMAAGVFETLNSRGIELSTADLLRTWLLGRGKDDPERDDIAAAWEPILAMHDDANVDDFIRHYWLSHHGDVKGRKLYRHISDWVEKNDVNPRDFSTSLEQAAGVYQDLATASDKDGVIRRNLEAVKALGAKALMPPLLSAWQEFGPKDVKGRQRLVKALVSLYVRHILIGGRDNSELEQTAFAIAEGFRHGMTVELAVQKMNSIVPDDSTFVADFSTASIARRTSAAYVLRQLEEASRPTKELKVATPDLVHVEHIYPQVPKPGHRWSDHEDWVERIGNLTPLAAPFNTALQNSPFPKKRPIYKTSDLVITKQVAGYSTWDANTITRRQESLAKLAPGIWPYPK